MARPWTRLDAALAVGLAGLAFGTRAAVRMGGFHSLDAGLLALGIEGYDFDSYRPHPPYYPLTILLGHALRPWMGPLDALAWLSVGASAVIAAGTFAIGREYADRWTAIGAAVLTLASPVALRNGSVPLSYALEGAASLAVAVAAVECRRHPGRRWALALGAVTSLAIGIRPSSAILLAPLALWGCWGSLRRIRWAVTAGAAVTLPWVVGMLWAGGGWDAFAYGLTFQSRLYVLADPVWRGGWPALQEHMAWLLYHLQAGFPFIVTLSVVCLVGALGVVRHWPKGAGGMLVAWMGPGLGFYVLVYAGWPVYPEGYLMALLPGIALAAAFALRSLFGAVTEPGVPRPLVVAGVVCVAAIGVQPLAWMTDWSDDLDRQRAAQAWHDSWEGLEQAFPPNETALVAFYAMPWLQLEHPNYLAWYVELAPTPDGTARGQVEQWDGASDKAYFDNVRDGPDDPPHPIPPHIRRVVLVDGHPEDELGPLTIPEVALQTSRLPGGRDVSWFDPAGLGDIESALHWMRNDAQPPPRRIAPPE